MTPFGPLLGPDVECGVCGCLGVLLVLALMGVSGWFIFKKAGFEPVLGLLMAIPIFGLFLLLYLAFVEWPFEKELHYFQDEVARSPKNEESEEESSLFD